MAVYTHITRPQLQTFMARYPLGALEDFFPIEAGSENSNYRVEAGGGKYILTLFEKRVRTEEVPFFLALIEHLAERGIPCPRPVRAEDGNALGELADRPAAVVAFLPGQSVLNPGPEHCAALGGMLAEMHLTGLNFPLKRVNALGPSAWRELLVDGPGGEAIDIRRRQCDEIVAQWPKDLPSGIVHADLFPDNVFFAGGELCGVIDFYFACNDFLAYDLAICVNAWCADSHGRIDDARARALVTAYSARRALTEAEVAALPLLLRGAAMRFFATRHYDRAQRPDSPLDPGHYARILAFHENHPDAAQSWLS